MNILILTPDRVGSTLLQRLVTIYANINDPDNLTINLHELTNGLTSYYNSCYKQDMIGKKPTSWGYHQSLNEIVNLIDNSNTDITSRLAYYHIKNRKDNLPDQLSFYKYLNENFFIISARRRNVFEHALSWGIAVESKKLNTYTFQEKFETFKDIYSKKINIDDDTLNKYLNQYVEYVDWVDTHFQVNSYFYYEDDIDNVENFILGLNPFNKIENKKTWYDQFGITWNNWNKMHYLLSLVPFNYMFTDEEKYFMTKNISLYTNVRIKIQDMMDNGILIGGIPIKLQSFAEKTDIIYNLNNCLDTYNKWIDSNDIKFAITYDANDIVQMLSCDNWNRHQTAIDSVSKLTYNDISEQLLLNSDLKGYE